MLNEIIYLEFDLNMEDSEWVLCIITLMANLVCQSGCSRMDVLGNFRVGTLIAFFPCFPFQNGYSRVAALRGCSGA